MLIQVQEVITEARAHASWEEIPKLQRQSPFKIEMFLVRGEVVSDYRGAYCVEMSVSESKDVAEGQADCQSGYRQSHKNSNAERQDATQATYTVHNQEETRNVKKMLAYNLDRFAH